MQQAARWAVARQCQCDKAGPTLTSCTAKPAQQGDDPLFSRLWFQWVNRNAELAKEQSARPQSQNPPFPLSLSPSPCPPLCPSVPPLCPSLPPLCPCPGPLSPTWMVQERNIMSVPSWPRLGMYSRMILYLHTACSGQ